MSIIILSASLGKSFLLGISNENILFNQFLNHLSEPPRPAYPIIIFVTFQYSTVPISTGQNGVKAEEVKLKIEILKLFGVYYYPFGITWKKFFAWHFK